MSGEMRSSTAVPRAFDVDMMNDILPLCYMSVPVSTASFGGLCYLWSRLERARRRAGAGSEIRHLQGISIAEIASPPGPCFYTVFTVLASGQLGSYIVLISRG